MSDPAKPAAETLWPEIAKVFSNRAFMRVSPSWLSGLGSRAGASRLDRLQATGPAKKLKTLINGLDKPQLQRLLVYSEVNHDQALSALRLTLVANISIPVGMLVLFNQFLPGNIQAFVATMPTGTILLPVVIALAIVVSILWFAYAGVDAARDLNHLLRLSLAEAARPAGEDNEAPDTLEMITDLT
ncbi:MAG: hypothetical protein RLO80_01920 [Hyphomonas sp.]